MRPLLEMIENGDIDPSFVVTHKMALEDAPYAYDIFKNKQDDCIKVVLKPGLNGSSVQKIRSFDGTSESDMMVH